MRVLRYGVFFASAAGAVVLASCSGGGSNPSVLYSPAPNYPTASPGVTSTPTQVAVGPGASTSPTTTPSSPGVQASATAAPTNSGTPMATSTPTMVAMNPSQPPTMMPTTGATTAPPTMAATTAPPTMMPSAPASMTPAPAGSSNPSAAQCATYAMENASQNGATPPPPTQITYQLNMSGTTHDLPAYEDETGSSVTTSYTTANGQPTNVTTAIADYQYSSSANNSNVTMGTPVAYSTIQLDNTAMFSMSKSTEVTTTSPCVFVAGSTYYVTVEALGGVQQPTAAVDSFNTSTHTITFPLLVSATSGNTFPANTTADIIISKSTP